MLPIEFNINYEDFSKDPYPVLSKLRDTAPISFVCKIVTLNSANAALAEIAVAAPTKNENSFMFIYLSFAILLGLRTRELISKKYL